ncbi:alpha/beta fold hydrolase (plasmid) [Rhizobium leguminosarum]|uniref:Alpha/beta fold hydrolase n=1 Tax=Rhizobium leguminosarum bv. viciae TaxID=387 RepID=A0A8G2J1U6_RHILV|nr:alpha/beta fold hydrolase [Rhizobium leguminosarum]MCA2434412.1 alpha/beta fold hydrolase [Rhizobium leguminosarum]NKK05395.1 alpha/beta fold hydrolase [Rhizobium leguminosarum bv. viciae]NKK19564.1 alpha/beta fold hydrolase [Rhizobium leguminosarum bv. viciae]TBF27631.1 alpha/beta fold hydrolase [Rhizobium leguminosarum]TBF28366.1 alpha/beta fold hydrolase [Rhizobium leguminosarum]
MTEQRLNGFPMGAKAMLVAIGLAMLAGCATRPSPDVLNPVHQPVHLPAHLNASLHSNEAAPSRVSVLAATNRSLDTARGGFGSTWADNLTYEQYAFSVPPGRKDTTITYPTSRPDPERQFAVIGRKQLAKDAFVEEALRSTQSDGTVGIFVHGYNYSYQEALFRTAQIAADANIPGSPILFSWPSAAAVAGYVADRDAALSSRSDLDSLVTSLSASGKVKRIILFGHSMGGFLVMETVRELKLQHRDDVIGKLAVILAAPDIDVDVFRSQLKDIGRMPMPISLLVSKDDRALVASSFIAGERARVGRLDIDDPVIREAALKERLRVIDITSIQASDGLGHDRYASLAKFGAQLASFESGRRSSAGDVGAYVFDAAGAAVASPFRLAGRVVGSQ